MGRHSIVGPLLRDYGDHTEWIETTNLTRKNFTLEFKCSLREAIKLQSCMPTHALHGWGWP